MIARVLHALKIVGFNPIISSFNTNIVRAIRRHLNRKMGDQNEFDLLFLPFKSLFAVNAYKEVHVNVLTVSDHLNYSKRTKSRISTKVNMRDFADVEFKYHMR